MIMFTSMLLFYDYDCRSGYKLLAGLPKQTPSKEVMFLGEILSQLLMLGAQKIPRNFCCSTTVEGLHHCS